MTVLLDLDGVLCDFLGGLCGWLGIPLQRVLDSSRPRPLPYRLEELLGVEDPGLSGLNAGFWAGLEPYPWARELVAYLDSVFGRNVALCTSVGYLDGGSSYFSEAAKGKEKWICKHFPQFSRRTVLCFGKDLLASPSHILIDDSEEMVGRFTRRGGVGVLFPRPWNRLHVHAENPLEYIGALMSHGRPACERTEGLRHMSA